jgi:outer membrane protein TolC
VKTRVLIILFIIIFLPAFVNDLQLSAQESLSLGLDNAIDLALQNNHLLNIRRLQIDEKQQKVSEDKVKYLPTVIIG